MRKTLSQAAVPAVGEGKRGEQGHIGYLLRQAGAAHRLRMERALADFAVTLPQFSVLTMLVAYPGASGADLARLSLLTPQTMSVIVSNLERNGAVSRRPHAVHGRIRHIEVTAAGRRLLAKCRARVKAVEEDLLAGISRGDEQMIRRWLVKVALRDCAV
ncbi:MAG TPA: MarR family winged helix-turn-helix transcriptional regulator [Rhodocyclaceae bacterium]|nr:MarR family winged helix-turn-helix transcriptional regulator [Rhodocyclaceae bacterium]